MSLSDYDSCSRYIPFYFNAIVRAFRGLGHPALLLVIIRTTDAVPMQSFSKGSSQDVFSVSRVAVKVWSLASMWLL